MPSDTSTHTITRFVALSRYLFLRVGVGNVRLPSQPPSQQPTTTTSSCNSNESAFEFENGAVLHYHFAHTDHHKDIDDALKVQGTELSNYDAVFANPGNRPQMKVPSHVTGASRVKEEVQIEGSAWVTYCDSKGVEGSWILKKEHGLA